MQKYFRYLSINTLKGYICYLTNIGYLTILEATFHEMSVIHSNSLGTFGEDAPQYRYLTLSAGQELSMYVVSVGDPDNVLCQPVASSGDLDAIMDIIQDKYNTGII